MDLDAQLRHVVAGIGAVGFGDGGQQGGAGVVDGVARGGAHVDRHCAGEADGAGGEDFGLHLGQHAADIGVVDDAAAAQGGFALTAGFGIGQGHLKRRLGHGDALHADTKAGVVHHGEHGGHALVWFTDQPALCAVILHDGGG